MVKLYSQEEYGCNTALACQKIVAKVIFAPSSKNVSCEKAMYLFESLESGKSKYLDMRRVLLDKQVRFPGCNKLANHRTEIT